jgi:hypothetical protein
MNIIALIGGVILILIMLGDAFETIVLPRRVTRRVRFARLFFRFTWESWLTIARMIKTNKLKDTFLGFFGPLSIIVLIILWATGLIIGFALVHWSFGTILKAPNGIGSYIYMSGTTFYTLGLGDVVPGTAIGMGLVAFEAGLGFGFLALVISYLPLLNQSFARREIAVALLDSHAGSPPTAAEMLLRHIHQSNLTELNRHFQEWERWSAELLESLLSYPMLAFFRSHHDNQSWLGSLTAILDAAAFVLAGTEINRTDQPHFTFAMIRHTIVDLAQIFNCPPLRPATNRLTRSELERIYSLLAPTGLELPQIEILEKNLSALRQMYEPYVYSLSRHLHVTLPLWIPKADHKDNWQTSPWRQGTVSKRELVLNSDQDRKDHF